MKVWNTSHKFEYILLAKFGVKSSDHKLIAYSRSGAFVPNITQDRWDYPVSFRTSPQHEYLCKIQPTQKSFTQPTLLLYSSCSTIHWHSSTWIRPWKSCSANMWAYIKLVHDRHHKIIVNMANIFCICIQL
jgi:hypothetical protein